MDRHSAVSIHGKHYVVDTQGVSAAVLHVSDEIGAGGFALARFALRVRAQPSAEPASGWGVVRSCVFSGSCA
jgi:hypothetical protein